MATNFYKLTLKGQPTVDEIQSAVGKSGGMIVRIHSESGSTDVYLAAEESAKTQVSENLKSAGKLEEINASAVTKLG